MPRLKLNKMSTNSTSLSEEDEVSIGGTTPTPTPRAIIFPRWYKRKPRRVSPGIKVSRAMGTWNPSYTTKHQGTVATGRVVSSTTFHKCNVAYEVVGDSPKGKQTQHLLQEFHSNSLKILPPPYLTSSLYSDGGTECSSNLLVGSDHTYHPSVTRTPKYTTITTHRFPSPNIKRPSLPLSHHSPSSDSNPHSLSSTHYDSNPHSLSSTDSPSPPNISTHQPSRKLHGCTTTVNGVFWTFVGDVHEDTSLHTGQTEREDNTPLPESPPHVEKAINISSSTSHIDCLLLLLGRREGI